MRTTMFKTLSSVAVLATCLLCLAAGPIDAQDSKDVPELKAGDKAPDFEVTTITGDKLKLSDRFGEQGRPTVLLFSRANW